MENAREKRRKKLTRLLLALLLLYLTLGIVSGVMTILWTIRHGDVPEPEESGCGVGWMPDDGQDRSPEAGAGAEENVTIAGTGAVTVPAGAKNTTVDFYNPKENDGLYDLTFELRLRNESPQGYEVLYTSGLVSPGEHIYEIGLSRALEAGVYDAVVHIQPYRMDRSHTRTNNADIVTALIVR